jgi:hypothetical protein
MEEQKGPQKMTDKNDQQKRPMKITVQNDLSE